MSEVQETNPPINSREWWETYFQREWERNSGSSQTRHFMETIVSNLAPPELHYMQSKRPRILDWGCAFGEGVAVLASSFQQATVVGLDFASGAVEEARRRFPERKFLVTPDGDIPEEFDVIVTSNCLEHFEYPIDLMKRHLSSCRTLYIAMVPYNEYPLHEQHRAQFREESFPERIRGFARLQISRVKVDPHYWPGDQLLAVYGGERYLAYRDSPSVSEERGAALVGLDAEQLRSRVISLESELTRVYESESWKVGNRLVTFVKPLLGKLRLRRTTGPPPRS